MLLGRTDGIRSGKDRGDGAAVGRAGGRRLPGVLRRVQPPRTPASRCAPPWCPYASYFDTLRTDVAGGGADDIFWINNSHFAEYADNAPADGPIAPSAPDWEPSVVGAVHPRRGAVGVPQLTDAGIALYYNADLLAAAGVEPSTLGEARWGSPTRATTRCARCWLGSPSTPPGDAAMRPDSIPRPGAPVGLQRRQRPAGHHPELHRLGGRGCSARATGSPSTTRRRSPHWATSST